MSLKSRVEAALFLTDKPMVAAAIAKLVNEDVQLVRQAIMQLIFDYEQRNCALEISDDDDGYMMQVKDEFANLANDLAPIDLPIAVVRTLSAIAIKQPVLQSEIVRIRGAGAYEHIPLLLERELITKKEEGRSHLLSTTKKFQEYFRLSQDAKALRSQLKEQDKEEKPGEANDQQLELPLENELTSQLSGQEGLIQEVQSLQTQEASAQADESQVNEAQLEAAEASVNTQILADEMENFQVEKEAINQIAPESEEEPSPPTKKSSAGIADWSDNEEETASDFSPNNLPNHKPANNDSQTDGNIAITENRFMGAPTVN